MEWTSGRSSKIKVDMDRQPLEQDEAILNYIPQRPPFVMIDALYEKGDKFASTGLTITDTNIMTENGEFKEGGIIENIAQTAALFAGVKYKEAGEEVPFGYIAGIKNVKIVANPKVGDKIFTTTTLTNEIMNIQIVEGIVKNEQDKVIASCELRIFIDETSKK